MMGEIAVCAVFRNEGPFIQEWLDWHRHLGVTQFFLYDNDSVDGGGRDLGPDVTLRQTHGLRTQLGAYRECLDTVPDSVEWVAFLDLDEFLYHPDGVPLVEVLPHAQARHEGQGVTRVWVPWRLFGWTPHRRHPPGGVIPNYLWRVPDESPLHAYASSGKSLVRVSGRTCHQILNPHHFVTSGLTWTDSGLLVNHYWTRSLEDIDRKLARPRADNAGQRKRYEFHVVAPDQTTVYDPRLRDQAVRAGLYPVKEVSHALWS